MFEYCHSSPQYVRNMEQARSLLQICGVMRLKSSETFN